MTQVSLVTSIARKFRAYLNCDSYHSPNPEWKERHAGHIEELVDKYLPHGSGFDSGTTFDFVASKPNRLVFFTSYHHMDDSGCYDGWTYHNVIITPDLQSGFNLRVTGRDKRDIKDYIGETFYDYLNIMVDEHEREAAYSLDKMNEKTVTTS